MAKEEQRLDCISAPLPCSVYPDGVSLDPGPPQLSLVCGLSLVLQDIFAQLHQILPSIPGHKTGCLLYIPTLAWPLSEVRVLC